MSKYELALKIATDANKGQVDKAGVEYINHPLKVASLVYNEKEKIVALLHDTIEDTYITEQHLIDYGFSNEIIEAVKVLTHSKDVPYMDYIQKIKGNKLARKVKIADLTHNSDLTRLKNITEKDRKRCEKYKKALMYLS